MKLNYIYLNQRLKRARNYSMKEFSGDMYNLYKEIAKATGGIVKTTAKPKKELEKLAPSL